MQYVEGEKVRIRTNADTNNKPEMAGAVGTVVEVYYDYERQFPYRVETEPGVSEVFSANELEPLSTAATEPATATDSHEYRLGYVAGYEYNVFEGTFSQMREALQGETENYRNGYRAGLEYQLQEIVNDTWDSFAQAVAEQEGN